MAFDDLFGGIPDPFQNILHALALASPASVPTSLNQGFMNRQSIDPAAIGYQPPAGVVEEKPRGQAVGPQGAPGSGAPPSPPATSSSGSGSGARQAGPPIPQPGAVQPSGSGMAPDANIGNDLKYPTQNPQFALQSALLNRGVNPFRANPGMSLLMERAPGLAQAFMLNNVGTNAQGMAAAGGEGAMFGSYLDSLLGQSGGMTNALSSAMTQVPGVLNQIKGMQDALAAGGGGDSANFATANPFAGALASIYGNPQSAASAFAALGVPFMSPGVGQAYQRGLTDIAGMGVRQTADDWTNGVAPRNFWEYLFPGL